jgi:hypothetical protein
MHCAAGLDTPTSGTVTIAGTAISGLGAAAFHDELLARGVSPDVVHYEPFDAGYLGIDYRYPLALAWLAKRLVP